MTAKAINLIAIVSGIGGAFIISQGIIQLVQYGYVLFMISAIATGVIQYRTPSQHGLLVLTGFYLAINVFGLLRWSGSI